MSPQSPSDEPSHSGGTAGCRLAAEREAAGAKSETWRQSEARYRSLVEASPDAMLVVDPSGRVVFATPRARAVLGYATEERIEGSSLLAFVALRDRESVRSNLARLFEGRTVEPREYGVVRRDGAEFPASILAAALGPTGQQPEVMLVIRDLTEQKRREVSLRASEARFAAIFRSNPIATSLTHANTARVVDVNEAFLKMAGFSREEVMGECSVGLGLWSDAAERASLMARIRTEGVQSIERQVTWKSGCVRDVIASFELIELDGERFLLGMWRDITARRRAEASLRESEQRFRQVVESISEVFWVADEPDGRITYISPSFERIGGRSVESFLAAPECWAEVIHPEDQPRVLAAIANRTQGGFDETCRIIRPDGTQRWVRARAYPVTSEDGTVRRVIGVAEDVTERKELEIRFLHTQRLEAVGTLASGVAHEMNNVLAPFMVVPDLLKAGCQSAEDRELLRMLEETARRGSGIVKQLLAFTRDGETECLPLQLGPLVDDLCQIIRATFPREITLRREMPANLPPVTANPTQLHQVLLNLCLNARDAMPGGGVLTIEAGITILGPAADRIHPGAKPGEYVVVSVHDTGKGIPPEVFSRIFDPFFTTKPTGRGTGLGLSTASNIVNNHGGFITVHSEVGRGSVFRVHLGLSRKACAPPSQVPGPPAPNGMGERVLVVDDEDPVRKTLSHLLEQHGYAVTIAADGAEALATLAAERDSIGMLVTDYMMPNVDGPSLIRDVRRIAPDLPIIAMTGSVDSAVLEQLQSLDVTSVLRKPFLAREIIEAVQHCFQRRQPALLESLAE